MSRSTSVGKQREEGAHGSGVQEDLSVRVLQELGPIAEKWENTK